MRSAEIADGRARIACSANGSTSAARRLAALLILWSLSDTVLAHKLQVFAFAEGARIGGSTYFAGGGAASGARIEVRDGEGRLLAELKPDGEGRFVYTAAAPVDHLIRAVTADGHDAEWRVGGDELIAGFAPAATPGEGVDMPRASASPSAPEPASRPPAGSAPAIPGTTPQTYLDPVLEAAIEQAVARQVRPLREQLLAAHDRVLLQDALGGLGYILGLTGLALWWASRRRTGPR